MSHNLPKGGKRETYVTNTMENINKTFILPMRTFIIHNKFYDILREYTVERNETLISRKSLAEMFANYNSCAQKRHLYTSLFSL